MATFSLSSSRQLLAAPTLLAAEFVCYLDGFTMAKVSRLRYGWPVSYGLAGCGIDDLNALSAVKPLVMKQFSFKYTRVEAGSIIFFGYRVRVVFQG